MSHIALDGTLGAAASLATLAPGTQNNGLVTTSGPGNHVLVAWIDGGVRARILDATGAPLGNELALTTGTSPRLVAISTSSRFLLVTDSEIIPISVTGDVGPRTSFTAATPLVRAVWTGTTARVSHGPTLTIVDATGVPTGPDVPIPLLNGSLSALGAVAGDLLVLTDHLSTPVAVYDDMVPSIPIHVQWLVRIDATGTLSPTRLVGASNRHQEPVLVAPLGSDVVFAWDGNLARVTP